MKSSATMRGFSGEVMTPTLRVSRRIAELAGVKTAQADLSSAASPKPSR